MEKGERVGLFNRQQSKLQPRARRSTRSNYYRTGQAISAPKTASSKIAAKSRPALFGRLSNAATAALIIFGLVYAVILSSTPQLVVTSQVYHPAEVYLKSAQAQFGSLKNRSKLTLDQHQIEAALKRQFPEIATAVVDLSLISQKPSLKLAIALPSVVLNNGSGSYVVSAQGIVVGQTNDLKATANNLTILNDQSGLKVNPGQSVLSTREIDFINLLIAECQRAKVPIQTITLPPIAQELDLKTADRPYFVKFHLGADGLTQVGQFLAAREQLASSPPAEYVDVRVLGKIFYR